LFTIAANQTTTWWRTIAQMPVVVEPFDESGSSPLDRFEDREPTPEELCQAAEHRSRIRECIDALPEGLKALCHLVYLQASSRRRARVLHIPWGRPRQHSAHHPAAQEMSGE